MTELCVRNRQRVKSIDLALLRQIARSLLTEMLPTPRYEIGVYIVSAAEITRLNETFLSHSGSTDVISFHYPNSEQILRGEIFISIDDALAQANEFQTLWQCEMVRYLVHGLLHLKGVDDRTPAERRIMKRRENQLLDRVAAQFPLLRLSRKPTLTGRRRSARRTS